MPNSSHGSIDIRTKTFAVTKLDQCSNASHSNDGKLPCEACGVVVCACVTSPWTLLGTHPDSTTTAYVSWPPEDRTRYSFTPARLQGPVAVLVDSAAPQSTPSHGQSRKITWKFPGKLVWLLLCSVSAGRRVRVPSGSMTCFSSERRSGFNLNKVTPRSSTIKKVIQV